MTILMLLMAAITAENGLGAIKLLGQNEFDVILSDVKLRMMNGLELGE